MEKSPGAQKKEAVLERKFVEAAYTMNFKVLKKCLSDGVNPNVLSEEYGQGALHIAAQRGDLLLGKTLLQFNGTNINNLSDHNRTPLYMACIFNKKKFAIFLLKHDADPNIPDTCGRTPLHMCVRFGGTSIISHLIAHGANINALDVFEQTPLSLALTDYRNKRAARILLAHGVDFDVERQRRLHIFFETVLQCKSMEDIELVNLLLAFDIDVNMVDPLSGRTCLHFVAISGYLPLATMLVDKGATLKVKDFSNRTPAKVAKEYGNMLLHKYLLTGHQQINTLLLMKYVMKWKQKCVKPALRTIASIGLDEDDDEEEVDNWKSE